MKNIMEIPPVVELDYITLGAATAILTESDITVEEFVRRCAATYTDVPPAQAVSMQVIVTLMEMHEDLTAKVKTLIN